MTNRTRFKNNALIVTVTVDALIASAAHSGRSKPPSAGGRRRMNSGLYYAKAKLLILNARRNAPYFCFWRNIMINEGHGSDYSLVSNIHSHLNHRLRANIDT